MEEQLDLLDSLEILSFVNQRKEYPLHYHDTYCISLIEKGVFGENDFVAPQGSIVIAHPYEVHCNKLVENIDVSFTTFYVSQDVVNFISPYDQTSFGSKVIDDTAVCNKLNGLIQFVRSNRQNNRFNILFEPIFYQFLADLSTAHGLDQVHDHRESPVILDTVKQYILDHLNSKIDLTELGNLIGMSKFQFIRWFKLHVGLTPFEYILLKRVGYGKELIQQGLPLVDVSYNAGFYDQSHFSNYFKKYIGMSPNVYRKTCNIFQDI